MLKWYFYQFLLHLKVTKVYFYLILFSIKVRSSWQKTDAQLCFALSSLATSGSFWKSSPGGAFFLDICTLIKNIRFYLKSNWLMGKNWNWKINFSNLEHFSKLQQISTLKYEYIVPFDNSWLKKGDFISLRKWKLNFHFWHYVFDSTTCTLTK